MEKNVTIICDALDSTKNKVLLNDMDITPFVHRLSFDIVGSKRIPSITLDIVAFKLKFTGSAEVQAVFDTTGLEDG